MSRTGWYPPSTHPNAGYATVVVPPVCRTIAGATLPDADSTDSRLDSQGIAQDIIWLPHDVPGVQPSIKPSDQVLSIARCQGMGDSRRAILTERGRRAGKFWRTLLNSGSRRFYRAAVVDP